MVRVQVKNSKCSAAGCPLAGKADGVRHFPLFQGLVELRTAIGYALYSTYPAGDGSIAILCSTLPKSRRVR